MLVLLNPAAGGGRAAARWDRATHALATRLGSFTLRHLAHADSMSAIVAAAVRDGERQFVAAGGDGTVHLLINALLDTAAPDMLHRVTVGAVGLGSSNDFHKPSRDGTGAALPGRLDFDRAVAHDVGVLLYMDSHGVVRRRWWINNASIGVTAEGNETFNAPDAALRWLKRVSRRMAILYAAVRALLQHRPRPVTLRIDALPPLAIRVSNLGVLKNPNVAGSLRYDSPHEPAGGALHVHLLEAQRLPGLLRAFLGLARGRFTGRRGTRSWRATRLALEGDTEFSIEVDGEIVTARRAWFSVRPACLRICA